MSTVIFAQCATVLVETSLTVGAYFAVAEESYMNVRVTMINDIGLWSCVFASFLILAVMSIIMAGVVANKKEHDCELPDKLEPWDDVWR